MDYSTKIDNSGSSRNSGQMQKSVELLKSYTSVNLILGAMAVDCPSCIHIKGDETANYTDSKFQNLSELVSYPPNPKI